MIVLGQNYYPEDFEWAAARVPGVRPGRCAAIADRAQERVALLVEATDDAGPDLADRVKGAVADAIGAAPSEVIVVPRGAIEKTTSGKLRRAAMREAYDRGAFSTT
jgi:acyl-CoA synthetase (AMP-forming)/AMP-acid ligase II